MLRIEKVMAWPELEQAVRETPLLRKPEEKAVYPYEDADITLKKIEYNEVSPTSLYVVRGNLVTQTIIAKEIAREGYDPLELGVGLVLKNDSGLETQFVPPIVEETENDGQYILDGAHRTSIGRWLGRTHFLAVHVSGIRQDCPAYAYPNSWDELRIVESVPTNEAEKKHYRRNYRKFYRDFARLNGSKLREG